MALESAQTLRIVTSLSSVPGEPVRLKRSFWISAVLRSVRMFKRSIATFLSFCFAVLPEIWSKATVTWLTVGPMTKVGLATGAVPKNTVLWPASAGVRKRPQSR